jgi:asparagine synthetase A
MATKEQMEEVQKSLQMLLQQNEKMSDKIKALETENRAIKKGADDTKTRIDQNLAKWKDLNNQAEGLFTEMTEVLVRLDEDAVNSSFIQERTVKLSDFTQLVAVFDTEDTTAHSVKQEAMEEAPPDDHWTIRLGWERREDRYVLWKGW